MCIAADNAKQSQHTAMVVTRQGTETSPAVEAPGGGHRARSPRKGGVGHQGAAGLNRRKKDLSPKRHPKGAGTPEPFSSREKQKFSSSEEDSDSSPPPKERKGKKSQKVQLNTKAERIAESGRTGRGNSNGSPLLKGGPLRERLQTGVLPFVREMSDMTDSSEEEEAGGAPGGPDAAPYARRRTAPAATASAAPGAAAAAGGGATAAKLRREASAEEALLGRAPARGNSRGLARAGSSSSSINLLSSSSSSLISTGSRISGSKLGQLLLTYFCYASLYLTRKPFATTKKDLETELGLSASALGGVDSSFLGAYAASQLLLAPALLSLPGGVSLSTILALGYAVSAFTCLLIYGLPVSLLSPFVLCCIWGVNGAAQALAFPLIVSSLSSWLSDSERGGVLGVWTTCQQVGSILASYITAAVLSGYPPDTLGLSPEGGPLLGAPLGGAPPERSAAQEFLSRGPPLWRVAFLVPSIWVFGCALLLGRGLRGPPGGALAPAVSAAMTRQQQQRLLQQQRRKQGKSLFKRTLQLGSIRRLCAAYFCVKLVRYSLLYWMPYYLEKHVHLSSATAAHYCIFFDAGGVFGSVALGWLSDRLLRGRRLLLLSPLCFLSGVSLLLLHWCSLWGPPGALPWLSQIGLLLAGAAIAAPDSVLGGAAAADACRDEPVGEAEDLAATASCIVNGSGSVGSIVQGLLAPALLSLYGWDSVFWFLAGTAALGSLCLLPGAIRDMKVLRKKRFD